MPADQQDLFFVRRNTNRNEVHYAIKAACDAPVVGYWKMFEKGPDVTEPVTIFEQMAFGIAAQKQEGDAILLKLNALPDRTIRIERDPAEPQRFRAYMPIAGRDAELTDFYVFAEPGFLMPSVKYIDIRGNIQGEPVTERIEK
jgi:Domain of unknown function (DUF4833)